MNKVFSSLRVAGLCGIVMLGITSCDVNPAPPKINGEKTDSVVKAKWIDPQRGKIWGKVNIVQIPLTAMENHIMGPVKSVRYKDYSITGSDTARALEDSGYNVYDKAGHLVDQNEYSKDGKQKWKCIYKYDDKNLATEWDFKFYYRHDSQKSAFKYDEKGRLAEKMEVGATKGETRRLVYKYDEKGNELEELEYYGNSDKPWVTSYVYDDRGFQIAYVHKDETGRVLEKRIQEYDNNGNKIAGANYTSDTSIKGKWVATLDSKGRPVTTIVYKKDGMVQGSTKMKYDDWDNLTEVLTYKPDGSVDTAGWNSYTEFEYDSHGNAVKETWYKLKGGKKVMTDVAERVYEYY